MLTPAPQFVARISRRWMVRNLGKTFELCRSGPVVVTTRGADTHVIITEELWRASLSKVVSDEPGD